MHQHFELTVDPSSEAYDPSDDRWDSQVAELVDALGEIGTIAREATPQRGTKGSTETIILALGSSGALLGAVEVFKAWIARDRERNFKVSIRRAKGETAVAVNSKGMSQEHVAAAMDAAVQKALGKIEG